MTVYAKPLVNNPIAEEKLTQRDNAMLDSFYEAMHVNELIQEAERLKINKRYGKSVEVLQIAQRKMFERHSKKLDLLLKLPMYLQLAGQEYNGWMEFFRIKSQFYEYEKNGEITHAELLFYESKVSGVMALFQDRKGESSSCIYYTIRSYLESLTSLMHIIEVQEDRVCGARDEEERMDLQEILEQARSYLQIKRAPFQYISSLASILTRLERIECLESFNKLIQLTMLDLPTADYLRLEEQVYDIMTA